MPLKLATEKSEQLAGVSGEAHGEKHKKEIILSRQRPAGVGENFIVVWLGANINLTNRDFRHSIKKLRLIVNFVKISTDPNECQTFLNQINDEKIFLIVSSSLGQQLVPQVENLPHLHSIYIFCGDRSKYLSWSSNHQKIKDVFIDITPLCQLLKNDIEQCDTNVMSISILSKDNSSIRDFNTLDSSFMYSKLLKEILMNIEHNSQTKTNLVEFCRTQHQDNEKQLKIIEEFNKNYSSTSVIK